MESLPTPAYGAKPVLPPTHLLTVEQIAFYHEHGYLAIGAVMPEAEISEVRKIYDRLFNEDRDKAEGDYYDLSGAKQSGKKWRFLRSSNPPNTPPHYWKPRWWRI